MKPFVPDELLEERMHLMSAMPIEVIDAWTKAAKRVIELEAENAALREKTRWIPVSEQLPERDGFYLVLEDVNQVAGYYHWCKAFGWNTDGGRINIQTVTHWMPLPETPKGDEK